MFDCEEIVLTVEMISSICCVCLESVRMLSAMLSTRVLMSAMLSIVSFTAAFATPDAIGAHLGAEGIQVWSGNFYAVNAIESLGLTKSGGVVRVGLMSYNTADEVDRLLASVAAFATSR